LTHVIFFGTFLSQQVVLFEKSSFKFNIYLIFTFLLYQILQRLV
jgi:hypothetical protein